MKRIGKGKEDKKMKTKALLLLCTILALAACNSDDNDTLQTPAAQTTEPTKPDTTKPITFNLTATHPNDAATTRGGESDGWRWQSWDDDEPAGKATPAMTRAVKQDWEAGDAIFVFFTNVTVPRHLKMTYDGSSWTSVEYDGATATPGALQLSNGDAGTMTAVYLPYGNDVTVSAGGEPDEDGKYHTYAFSETPRAYYMTGTLPYEVIDNTVSGAFNMMIADGFVQIFLPDGENDQYINCQLVLDAVNPVRVASISSEGTITEIETTENERLLANDFTLPRYVYNDGNVKGNLFYGKVSDTYRDPGNYCFAMTKTSYTNEGNNNSGDEYDHPSGSGPPVIRDERYDYYVVGKTLASHDAIRLPATNSINTYKDDGLLPIGKWQKMGENETVKLRNFEDDGITIKDDVGTWYTCDFGTSVPEKWGIHTPHYTYLEAKGKTSELGVLPSLEQFKALSWKSKKWSTACVNGYGRAIAQFDTGFLWIEGPYWTNEDLGNQAYVYMITDSEVPVTNPIGHTWDMRGGDEKWFVRLMAR